MKMASDLSFKKAEFENDKFAEIWKGENDDAWESYL